MPWDRIRLGSAPDTHAAEQAQLGNPCDVPVLAAAIQCRSDVLVSGDRRELGARHGSWVSDVEILMLRAVLQRIIGEG